MNRDDVIRWAREAGLVQESEYFYSPKYEEADVHIDDLERFAALVAAAEREAFAQHCVEITRKAVAFEREKQAEAFQQILTATRNETRAAEREACAKVCESMRPSEREFDQRFYTACTLNANAIRARGQA